MKLSGRRQSKNVDDIRKQTPKMVKGWASDPTNVKGEFFKDERLAQTPSSEPSAKAKSPGAYKKLAAKVGKSKMADAAKRDTAAREKAILDRSEGYKNQPEMTILTDGWVPIPLKGSSKKK